MTMKLMDEESIVSFLQDCNLTEYGTGTRDGSESFFRLCVRVQREVCQQLQEIDGNEFRLDHRRHKEGGGGVTAFLFNGNVFQKANVDISVLRGKVPSSALTQLQEAAQANISWAQHDQTFLAIGISSVIHAKNPHVPSYHFNLRLILIKLGNGSQFGWYGGGMDISPFYLVQEDIKHFHQTLKATCEKHDTSYYPRFKKWCDEYFFLEHRGETRGLGGIFFDSLNSKEHGHYAFVQSLADTILPAYLPIVRARMNDAFTDREEEWKLLRNSRYIEFNLMYDRGVKFGLQLKNFKKEILFFSLPLTARWDYELDPEPGSREEELVQVLRCPRDWA